MAQRVRRITQRVLATIVIAVAAFVAVPTAAYAFDAVDPCHGRTVIFDGCTRLDTSHVDDLRNAPKPEQPKAEDDPSWDCRTDGNGRC